MNRNVLQLLPLCLMMALLVAGCAGTKKAEEAAAPAAQATVQQAGPMVYEGEVAGLSNKAKSISVVVGKGDAAKTMMVKFDDNTKGVDMATKGTNVRISYEMRGQDAYATDVQLKLAKLPAGVTEIKTPELQQLMDAGKKMYLVDPGPRCATTSPTCPARSASRCPCSKRNRRCAAQGQKRDARLLLRRAHMRHVHCLRRSRRRKRLQQRSRLSRR